VWQHGYLLCGCVAACRSDIYVYFNVNFNVLFKVIKVHLLVSELYVYSQSKSKYTGRRLLVFLFVTSLE